MKSISFGDVSKVLMWRGEKVKLTAGDFTWQDHMDYHAVTGAELGEAFASTVSPRLVAPLLWLHRRHEQPRLQFDEFVKSGVGGGGFADIEWVVVDSAEEDEPDPEASGGDT